MIAEQVLRPPWPDASRFQTREWLVTNGLGGYSSGTVAGGLSRRYHGLYMPNLSEPRGRHLLVSRVDESLQFGPQAHPFSGGALDTDTELAERMQRILEVRVGHNRVQWTFSVGGATLRKSLLMPHLGSTLVLLYELLDGDACELLWRPFLPFRRQDAPLGRREDAAPVARAYRDVGLECFSADSALHACVSASGPAQFLAEPLQALDQPLLREQLRGYEYRESTWSPGYLRLWLRHGEVRTMAVDVEPVAAEAVAGARELEEARTQSLIGQGGVTQPDPMAAQLIVAADQFIVRPESRRSEQRVAQQEGHKHRTVIAGYHWFGDWGRDTMISLEGLMLCTGRYEEARATLLTFAHYVQDGLLPNLFPEGASQGLYHTVDASLWYFQAVSRYVRWSGDSALLAELLPTLSGIVECYTRGTRFGIGVDAADGLVSASCDEHPLTWMDAHCGDLIVTPRRGKPVEIQALWYNALRLMSEWDTRPGAGPRYAQRADRVREAFNSKFWNAGAGALYDVIDPQGRADPSLRPNQLLAISLDHAVLDAAHWGEVIETVRTHLLTPYGLRTLAPGQQGYRRTYHGNLADRDAAYHQGTVWPWLIGPFIDAWLKVHPDRGEARALLAGFERHLGEAGVGSISEIFDAEAPHEPHGCIAQAWSVAEVLRVWQRTAA